MHGSLRLSLVLVFATSSWLACGSSSSDSGGAVIDDSDGGTTTDAGGQTKSDAGPSSDAGTTSDGGSGGFVAGAPITAAAETWTWVPFPNSACGNGSATGIGVNLNSASSRVLIYLEGGGACWSDLTCFTTRSAANFTSGYGEANFDSEESATLNEAFFDRDDATNPFKDYNFVFIPYCSGDTYSGNNVVTYPSGTATFKGYENVTAFLERIVPTFPSADRVILSGSSAGGYGALYNWYQTQNAFGSIRVDLIDDSGPYLPAAVLAEGGNIQTVQNAAWNNATTLPPCSPCTSDPSTFYAYYSSLYPTHKSALLSYNAQIGRRSQLELTKRA